MGGGAGHDVEVVGHPVVLQGEAEPGPGHHAQHHRRPHGHQATGARYAVSSGVMSSQNILSRSQQTCQ